MRARIGSALFAVMLLAAQVATAGPLGPHFTLTPFGGFTMYDGTFNYPALNPLTNIVYGGGRLGFQYNPWLGIEAAGGYSPTKEDITSGGEVDYWHVSGNLMFSPWVGFTNPFFFAGGGYSRLEAKPSTGTYLNQGNVEFGGGFNLWLNSRVGLRLEARDILWIPGSSSVEQTNNLVLGGGLTFAFGGAQSQDLDHDGIADKLDNCADTPRGAKVDGKGCPLDSDGDKVLDGLDQCAGTLPGILVDTRGCPLDTDGDGVFDGLDQCADTPKGATANAKGCPSDDDGDKVMDGLDKCSATPKGATVDETGCPKDSDGDGVYDGVDRCADTERGVQVTKDGCSIEVNERETELLDTGMMRLNNVNFESGKADLLPESYQVLDVVGQVLAKWPDLRIEVGGHTDSRGSEALNQSLSEARASTVLTYLTQKFPTLKPGQYRVRGYGETAPIAPNTTQLNMAKNRRVEFSVLNKEVLKRDTQKRRVVQGDEQK